MRWLAELKRRKVFGMAGLYLVGAWLVIQVAATLLPVFDAPPWVMKALVALLAVGFVAAIVGAWIYQLTPRGLELEQPMEGGDGVYSGPERRRAGPGNGDPSALEPRTRAAGLRAVIAAAVVASGLLALYALWPAQTEPVVVEASAEPTPKTASNKLVAVLPFRNRSALAEDAYFAEGIHDDLLTQLAKVAGLRVISRTSMMRYANTAKSMREIALELGAEVVLEGAVQRAGERVLITVQLIDGSSDIHLWAERYDRLLTTQSLFTIQAEIAKAVARATSAVLSPAETQALATGSTSNLLAYEAFLQGKLLAALDRATPDRFALALTQFDKAIALDAQFAEAYARKARIQLASYWFAYADSAMREAARQTTAQAVALAPDDIETWMAQAYLHYWGELDYASADAMLARIIERAPGHAEAWYARGLVARRDGRFEDTIAAFKSSLAIDPANTDTLLELSNTLATLGRYAQADELRARAVGLGADLPTHRAENALTRGQLDEAWAAIDGPNDFFVTLPFRIALASRKAEWIERALSTELWPERLRRFPDFPHVYDFARAEAWLVTGRDAQARALLEQLDAQLKAQPTPYPLGWQSTGFYFYYPCDLPGMLGDLDAVIAAEADWITTAPRDVWAESGVRMALAVAFARAGDADRALGHLELVAAQIGPVAFISMANSPGLDSLHDQPRYLALAESYRLWRERNGG